MKIVFLGDSITEGYGAATKDDRFVALVARATGAETVDLGIGGTRIARQRAHTVPASYDMDFLLRAEHIDGDADFVFVFGGTNDFGHGDAPIGERGDKTPYTFCGAMELLTELLLDRFGSKRLCFILPLPRADGDSVLGDGSKAVPSLPLSGYIDVMRDILDKKGIKYLDLAPLFPKERLKELTLDGLHPLSRGHALIAQAICEYLKANGVL